MSKSFLAHLYDAKTSFPKVIAINYKNSINSQIDKNLGLVKRARIILLNTI